MILIILGVFALLRQLGASSVGAAFGASLYLSTTVAMTAWTRLTMGEPLGLIFLLLASLVGCRYQATKRWHAAGLCIGFLLVGAALSKEMLLAAAPLPWYLGCCHAGNGRFHSLHASPRNRWLTVAIGLCLLVTVIPVAWVGLTARHEAFSLQYGRAALSAGVLVGRWFGFIIPSWPGIRPFTAALPTNFLFLSIVALGCRIALSDKPARASTTALLLVSLALPTFGALSYAPWPLILPFYGLPFQLGSSILFAVSVTALCRRFQRLQPVIVACSCCVLAGTVLQAYYAARQQFARQQVNYDLAIALPSLPPADSGFSAAQVVYPESWRGPGPALRRYSQTVTGQQVATRIGNVHCNRMRQLESTAVPSLLISYSNNCGVLKSPDRSFVHYYHYIDWPIVRLRLDSVRADVEFPQFPIGDSGRAAEGDK
jgi:hypothetical protein